LDFDRAVAIYSYARWLQRWILVHPIDIGRSSPFFSLFFYREIVKKYFHNMKWGSIPKYPSQRAMKVAVC
jgi:hypothetical protein